MTPKLGQAERLVLEELADVERRLVELDGLRARRDRLQETLKSIRRVDDITVADVRNAPVKPLEFKELVQRTFAEAEATRVEPPGGPSAAAMVVLRDAKKAMHTRDIVAAIQSRGWYTDRKYESLRATIAGTMNPKADARDGVEKVAPGTYRWLDSIPV